MTESKYIEYKERLTEGLEKEVVAFLNCSGGVIYIGVDKDGNDVGVSDADSLQLTIKDRLRNNISPSILGLFDIVAEQRGALTRIKIIVAGGPEKPYYIRKYGMSEHGAYIRVGSASEPMTNSMIERLFACRIRNSIGRIRSPRQDLTFEQLRIYYDTVGKTLNEQFAKNLELLNEEGNYNYVAYLLADMNGISVKTARYAGCTRSELIESNEYGYCSLIKATKQMMDRIEVENRTFIKMTSREREETRMWDARAMREALINAIVHNDYTHETAPKVEFFDDRMEITSAGGLPEGMTQDEFFSGLSVPRNKELMRIFKDIELVEQLGYGVPRILETYDRSCFHFSENFLRMVFPAEMPQKIETDVQSAETLENTESKDIVSQPDQPCDCPCECTCECPCEKIDSKIANLVVVMDGEMHREAILNGLNISHRGYLKIAYLQPAIDFGFIAMKYPNSPRSTQQRYYLTYKGKALKDRLLKNES